MIPNDDSSAYKQETKRTFKPINSLCRSRNGVEYDCQDRNHTQNTDVCVRFELEGTHVVCVCVCFFFSKASGFCTCTVVPPVHWFCFLLRSNPPHLYHPKNKKKKREKRIILPNLLVTL